MATMKCTLIACTDCIMFNANGEGPDDRPDFAEEVADHIGMKPGDFLASASGLDERGEYHRDEEDKVIDEDHPEWEARCEDWFSWQPCECCGSTLGGNRNRLALFSR